MSKNMADRIAYDWSELAFASKKPLSSLNAVMIAPPRKISGARIVQLLKEYLPKANIIFGISKEVYVEGFEGQPQFEMLDYKTAESYAQKVLSSPARNKVFTLQMQQRDLLYAIEKLSLQKVVFINGSWKFGFHTTPTYHLLTRMGIPYSLAPAFTGEEEARQYETMLAPKLPSVTNGIAVDELGAMQLALMAAHRSYDYNFQTGAVLAAKTRSKYTVLAAGHNAIVPYETYALLHGSERERHFSPPHDLNHYDTVHAEVDVLIKGLQQHVTITDTSLFVNLMPCPSCSRMIAHTPIKEVVYQHDHSEGYAIKLLQNSGKIVRRLVP